MKINMKKLFAGFLLGSLIVLPVVAGENESVEKDSPREYEFHPNALGATWYVFNDHSVYGLNYQHWFNKVGLDVTGGGYFNQNYLGGYDGFMGADVKLQFNLFETNQKRVFASKFYLWTLGGLNWNYEKGIVTDYSTETNITTYPILKNEIDAILGVGIGAELLVWQRMSIPIEFGFSGGFPSKPAMSVSVSSGLRFRF